MKQFLVVILTAAAALLVPACDDRAQNEQPGANPSTARPTIVEADLAVPADFEDEVGRGITAQNYKTELDSIETELNGS